MNNELEIIGATEISNFEQNANAGMTPSITRTRELARAQVAMAKTYPRDERKAEDKILVSCQRETLARAAIYQYPRGGQSVQGPSIRLAETLAMRWGNIDYGWTLLDTSGDTALLEAWATDLESNTRRSAQWSVKLERHTRMGAKKLTDPRDIYEMQANEGSRRVRACILAIIPPEVVEAAVFQCKKTLANSDKERPMEDRVKGLLRAFLALGVSQEMVEQRLKHGIELMTAEQLVEFRGIYNSLTDKASKREDWFDFGVTEKPVSKLAEKMTAAPVIEFKNPFQ